MTGSGGAPNATVWTDVSLQHLRVEMQQFSSERYWDQYHTPRNLVLALVGRILLRSASAEQHKDEVAPQLTSFFFFTWCYRFSHLFEVFFFFYQVGEVGELAELFQWRTESEAAPGLPGFSSEDRRGVEDELSDVLLYLTRLADRCGVDLGAAVKRKLEKNAAKYPADKCKGASDKYTKYQTESKSTLWRNQQFCK